MQGSHGLSALVAALPVGILVETPDRQVQVANAAFCEMFAIPARPEDLVGADCVAAAEAVAPMFPDAQAFLRRIEAVVAAGVPVRGEEVATADGRVLERDFLRVDLGTGALQIIWLYRDISSLAEARQALESARDQAVSLARQRSTLLATASHEVRTPLTGLLGLVEMLSETTLPGWAHEAIATIRASTDSLTLLLEDLLDLGRLDLDGQALRAVPFSPRELVAEAVDVVGPTARRSGVLLSAGCSDDVPDAVVGDPTRLRQVVLNLVVNAVKFAPGGEVTVRVGRAGTDLTLTVEDDGPGLDPAVAAHVFEPFVQGDVPDDQLRPGVGLGLAITAQLVARMGGAIAAHNRDPRGCRFEVRLPVVPPRDPLPEEPANAALAGLRVALSAPSDASYESVRRMLSRLGAQVADDPDAQSAGDVTAVVLVDDATDPGAAGRVDAARRSHPGARVVVLTRRDAARSSVPGAVTLGMPPGPSRLVSTLRGADDRVVSTDPSQLPSLSARVLLAEDDATTRTLLTAMLTSIGVEVVVVEDGEAAVAAALDRRPDLVLLDLNLPRLDGVAAVHRLRALPAAARLPLVVMSASALDRDRDAALSAGADAYLAKPVTRDDLVGALLGLVSRAREARTTALDRARLAQLVDEIGDASVVSDAARIFVEELPGRLEALRSAVSAADDARAREAAHALGSAALMLGVDGLGRHCRTVERASNLAGMQAVLPDLEAAAASGADALADYLAGSGPV